MTSSALEIFGSEMLALATQIDAPQVFIPVCGRNDRQGWSIDISEDGTEYVLSASERGRPYDIFRSTDATQVMEAVFVDITGRMALADVVRRYPSISPWRALLGMFGRPNPIKQQREIQIAQEDLLTRVNPSWGERCAIANAMRLRREVDFYFGVK